MYYIAIDPLGAAIYSYIIILSARWLVRLVAGGLDSDNRLVTRGLGLGYGW